MYHIALDYEVVFVYNDIRRSLSFLDEDDDDGCGAYLFSELHLVKSLQASRLQVGSLQLKYIL